MKKSSRVPRPKVKRLSIFGGPKAEEEEREEEEKEEPKKEEKRWVPGVSPQLKVPERLPYYRELPPKYEPAQPRPPQAPPQPVQPAGDDIGIWITVLIIIGVIIFAIASMGPGDEGCPTTCPGGMGVTVAPHCDCPPDCPYYFVITNPPEYYGYKQCSSSP